MSGSTRLGHTAGVCLAFEVSGTQFSKGAALRGVPTSTERGPGPPRPLLRLVRPVVSSSAFLRGVCCCLMASVCILLASNFNLLPRSRRCPAQLGVHGPVHCGVSSSVHKCLLKVSGFRITDPRVRSVFWIQSFVRRAIWTCFLPRCCWSFCVFPGGFQRAAVVNVDEVQLTSSCMVCVFVILRNLCLI